jgi:hypothetical protein
MYAQRIARLIKEVDQKLDDPKFVRNLYNPREEAPRKPKPEWVFAHLDLAIYDRAKPGLLIVQKGCGTPNSAMMPSPVKFLTVPPCSCTCAKLFR